MSGRKLSSFREYKRRLLLYAQANGISVVYTADKDSEGEWLPLVRRVKIFPDMTNSSEISTLLHELGHALDDTFADPKTCKRILRAYAAYYAGRPSAKQHQVVIDSEVRAWMYGIRIAKILKIRLGTWYGKEMAISLKEYSEVLK